MTTIAFRDGIMAADGMSTINNTTRAPGTSKKLWRLSDGSLAGGAGNAFPIAASLDAARGQNDIHLPETAYNTTILSVSPGGVVKIHTQGSAIEFNNAPFFAIGSGAEAAIGAMHGGATAEQAIEAAIRSDMFSGPPVQTLTFKLERGTSKTDEPEARESIWQKIWRWMPL